MTTQNEVSKDESYLPYLDHGFVGLVEVMGSDETIDESARMSYGKGTRTVSDRRALIRYLVRHQHTSPIEMGELRFHLKMPIFVMRQHVRHRTASLNEYSGRYSEMSNEFYIPDLERIQKQSTTNKQGSGEELTMQHKQHVLSSMQSETGAAYHNYLDYLNIDVARELARIQLPVSNYTELYWKIDLKNFLHYSKLRLDKHAQWEIRELANCLYNLARPHFPAVFEAFEDYILNGDSFSSEEMSILKQVVNFRILEQLVGESTTLSKREKDEFLAKFRS